MKSIVGYTGFVGSNLSDSYNFDGLYNSKNVIESYHTNPDLLIYSGIRAEKFIANKEPNQDKEIIKNAFKNIKKINPKRIVLISTVDVYKSPVNVDENSEMILDDLQPYGANRYLLEQLVLNETKNSLVIRLPGLYGKNIKKNFIFDLINIIPSILNEEKYNELNDENLFLDKYYIKQDNGFFKCKDINDNDKITLKEYFNKKKFSALNFTDSRATFQFYNLSYLWSHIEIALKNNINILNISSEPICISELYQHIKGHSFTNEISQNIPIYNYKSVYSDIFGGKDGYIFNKNFIMDDIKNFVSQYSNKY